MSLESHRVQSWATDFSSEVDVIFSAAVGARLMKEAERFNNLTDKFMSDGYISDKERQAMIHYKRNNMPVNEQRYQMEKFHLEHKNEFDEFWTIHAVHRKDAFAEYGIFNYEDFQGRKF